MRVLLLNPPWDYEGSIYFGCREPHLPLELGYARALLSADGHEALLLDAHAVGLTAEQTAERVRAFAPDLLVLTTAPTYLFWRCPPPELRVPLFTLSALRRTRERLPFATIAVGPHGSTTPRTTLEKLGVDAVVLGECEAVVRALANTPVPRWSQLPSVLVRGAGGDEESSLVRASTDLEALPALRWTPEELGRHGHHHHRFDGQVHGLGAEIEASRGCPFSCSFCAKETHRDKYRKRPLNVVLDELDQLCAAGVTYVYFIDELFLPNDELVAALGERPVKFGVQTRIDLWTDARLDRLGRAGCVSIEAGVESISDEGRRALDKSCKLGTDELGRRLIHARQTVPFVQATLMESLFDSRDAVADWRQRLMAAGVWVNDPVPLFPYPGSADYRRLWNQPDGRAWERAHDHYVETFPHLSDIQNQRVVRLRVLENEAIES